MKLPIIKLFTIIAVFAGYAFISGGNAYANAPIIDGDVLVKGTNAPVPGVWVKWIDSKGEIRYTQTNSQGKYSFPSWQDTSSQERTKEKSTKIDTNLDGVPDAAMVTDSSSGVAGFGCKESPHQFTIVIPKGQNYTASFVTYSFSNVPSHVNPPPVVVNPPAPTVQPTTAPACGVKCSTPADCQNAKDGCTACTNSPSGNVCAPPVTPTSAPACGVTCNVPADCQNAKDGCTACTNSPSGNVCAPPVAPTLPVTSTLPVTPTPLAAFNPASCTCDGIENSTIIPGQPATITSFAKVIGADVASAKVVDQKFFLAEGAETMATIIAKSEPIAASVLSNTPALVRYQSVWQVNIPQLKAGSTYRLWSQINCQPKQTAYNQIALSTEERKVLGSSSQNVSIFDMILNFFANLFGAQSTTQIQTQKTTETKTTAVTTNAPMPSTTNGQNKNSLQLYTFYPASVYEKTCSFIKFRVEPVK
jgi:hypothetical protein